MYKYSQYNDPQKYANKYYYAQYNDALHKDSKYNCSQINDTQHCDNKYTYTQHKNHYTEHDKTWYNDSITELGKMTLNIMPHDFSLSF